MYNGFSFSQTRTCVLEYLDFELEVGPVSGRQYPVKVVRSPGGEAAEIATFPFGELELENRLQAVQIALLRSGGQTRQVLSPEEQAVQDFGYALFMALLPGEVRSRYDVSQREAVRQGAGLRIKLRFQSPEMAALPWEFIYDPRHGEYVCLSLNTPLVRYLALPHPVRTLRATPPLRILGMTANPQGTGHLNVALEKQRVETALSDLQRDGLVSLTWLEGETWRDLQRAMRHGPWHIFHFIGHGGFDRAGDEGFIVLSDSDGNPHRLRATQLGRLLADHNELRLALLNACEGARSSDQDIFSSTAAILVRRGLPAVLAMQYSIADRAAIEFARTFYEALADGMPVDAATTEARQAISIAVAQSVEWGIPVLYMRATDGALFDIQGPQATQEAPASVPVPVPAAVQPDALILDAPPDETQQHELLIALFRQLVEAFNEDELQTLCFFLGVDYEMWSAQGKAGKVRGLINYMNRHHQIGRLIDAGKQLRADVEWEGVEEMLAAAGALSRATRTTAAAGAQTPAAVSASPLPFEPEMVFIPAGPFVMGSDPQKGEFAAGSERPQHTVVLPEFQLAKVPVTNAQYEAFVQAAGYHAPAHWPEGSIPHEQANHPVVNVSCNDALAYCRWLSSVTGKQYSLPSEAEWEKAARGPEGRVFPWGKNWETNRCNTREARKDSTTPVDAYPLGVSVYGVLDMAGNVWEWTRSLWGTGHLEPSFTYPYVATDGREDASAAADIRRVLRGGSFNYGSESARCACRNHLAPTSMSWYVGFRVAILE